MIRIRKIFLNIRIHLTLTEGPVNCRNGLPSIMRFEGYNIVQHRSGEYNIVAIWHRRGNDLLGLQFNQFRGEKRHLFQQVFFFADGAFDGNDAQRAQ